MASLLHPKASMVSQSELANSLHDGAHITRSAYKYSIQRPLQYSGSSPSSMSTKPLKQSPGPQQEVKE